MVCLQCWLQLMLSVDYHSLSRRKVPHALKSNTYMIFKNKEILWEKHNFCHKVRLVLQFQDSWTGLIKCYLAHLYFSLFLWKQSLHEAHCTSNTSNLETESSTRIKKYYSTFSWQSGDRDLTKNSNDPNTLDGVIRLWHAQSYKLQLPTEMMIHPGQANHMSKILNTAQAWGFNLF